MALYYIIVSTVLLGFGYATTPKGNIVNESYRSFKDVQIPNGLSLYSYRMTMPEMIWEYGNVLPRLDSLDLQSDSLPIEFYVLECSSCDHMIERDFENFNLTLKDSIDLNKEPYGGNDYRGRKKSRIYLARRK